MARAAATRFFNAARFVVVGDPWPRTARAGVGNLVWLLRRRPPAGIWLARRVTAP